MRYRNAVTVILTTIVIACLFATSYILGLGRPMPHGIPTGLVSSHTTRSELPAVLERATHHGLVFHRYRSAAGAEQAIARQDVYGVLVLGRSGPRLLVASAAGASVAHALEQVADQLAARAGIHIVVRDVRPLPPGDTQGLVILYVMLIAMLLGFLASFLVMINTTGLTQREWVGAILTIAIGGGLGLAIIVGPVTGGLDAPVLELWAALAAWIATTALFARAMLALVRHWAVVPTIGLFVLLGIPSSGAAVAPPLLPWLFRTIGPWLANAAATDTLRDITYFPHHQHVRPILVLAAWMTGSFALWIAVNARRPHRPEPRQSQHPGTSPANTPPPNEPIRDPADSPHVQADTAAHAPITTEGQRSRLRPWGVTC